MRLALLSPADVTSSYDSMWTVTDKLSLRIASPLKLVSSHLVAVDPSAMDDAPSRGLLCVPLGLVACTIGTCCPVRLYRMISDSDTMPPAPSRTLVKRNW